jgi:NAD(P)H-dependent flavin oxidoreductase YrpB (nitropropane dioxygenase family)
MSSTSWPLATLRTRLCDLLGIRYPIVQALMAGGWTTPELVSEVSNAGGLGVLAGARVAPERLREEIRERSRRGRTAPSGLTSCWRIRRRATRI